MLTFLDPPRLDTKITIEKANELGVQVKMITGDHKAIAKETCRLLGMGTDIKGTEELPELSIEELTGADVEGKVERLGIDYGPSFAASDGFAQVFPEHKYIIVEALRQRGHLVGMTGDGINDAPALKRADVGIAVQGATNAAQAAADIVLTRPGLSTIVTAIVTSRKIFQRMKNFVIYRVACTAQLLFFFFISCVFFDPSSYNPEWDPYFKLPVMALVSITILNDGTIISVAYDNVVASTKPEQWDLTTLYAVAASIGTPALVSSLLLLHVLLKSNDQDSMWTECGLPGLSFGQIQMLMYLKISLSDYASLFNCRCRGWMWERAPSEVVVVAATFAMFAATGLSLFLPPGEGMETVSPLLALVVWLYTAVWALVQDVSKMAGYALLHRFKFLSQDDVGFDDSALDNFTVKAAHLAKQTLHKKKLGLEAEMNRPPREEVPSEENEVSAV
jgi:H+-transporting ATPase